MATVRKSGKDPIGLHVRPSASICGWTLCESWIWQTGFGAKDWCHFGGHFFPHPPGPRYRPNGMLGIEGSLPPNLLIIFCIFPNFFIICCISSKRLSRVFTSATVTPLPLAMR